MKKIFFISFLSVAAFLIFPSASFACHQTHINFPAEGQNLEFSQLPAFISARYDTSPGPGIKNYYLDLYFGVPGNAQIVSGGFQGGFSSCVDDREAQGNPLDKAGDYFYVLYDVNQVEQAGGGLTKWIEYWERGTQFPWPAIPIDYAVSGFSVNKEVKLDPVVIIPGILGSSDKNGVWVIDPIFHTYDDLIATLKANGYTEGKDLFTMPYDWRQSNVLTALQLRDEINKVQNICACDKVDLVAHSMGGLAARQYIQSDKYENDVDQLIFLGTPHLGSPDAYLTWEGGEIGTKTGGILQNKKDQFSKFVLSREAKKSGFSSLFDYVRNKPISSVQELLPIYDYLRDKSTGNLRTYPNNYPQNTFLENLKIGVLNLLGKVKVINIVGELGAGSTLNTIRVVDSPNLPLWENGYPDGFDGSIVDRGFAFGHGDGMVPKNSSQFIVSDLNELFAEHGALPTEAEGLIFKKLTGKDASTTITTNTDSIFDINFKLLLIKILSPIDVMIIAPDGKRIGKDFSTNSEVNEIDGAFYSGFLTDDEYLTIPYPLDGEYKVEVQGTGTGSYTVATGYIGDNISVDKDFTANTSLGLVTNLNLSINNANPETLNLKPADITPPAINIISPQAKDYLRSEILPINISITDSESGVFSSEVKFDDRIISSTFTTDLFFEKLGGHKVSASASDFIGNATTSEVKFRIIATIPSTISDIERAYSLGWISKKSVKNTLIKKLENIQNHDRAITQKNLKTFLAELERENPKNVNDQAYNLLKEDINWLLNN